MRRAHHYFLTKCKTKKKVDACNVNETSFVQTLLLQAVCIKKKKHLLFFKFFSSQDIHLIQCSYKRNPFHALNVFAVMLQKILYDPKNDLFTDLQKRSLVIVILAFTDEACVPIHRL